MNAVWTSGPLNPASQHRVGQRAQGLIEQATVAMGKCLGCRLDQPGGARLILTSGGTESNNLALRGITGQADAANPDDQLAPIVISRIEHPSILATAKAMAAQGRDVRWLDVDNAGRVRLDQLKSMLDQDDPKAALVSIMSANNETGVIQPIEEAARICRATGVPLHVDATQTVGKQVFHITDLGVAAVTLSAHKFHGPAGVGALWIDRGIRLQPMLHGGEQQLDTRPGTEPVALIVAMAKALTLACEEIDASHDHMKMLRDRLENGLIDQIDNLVVHGRGSDRLPMTSLCVGDRSRSPIIAYGAGYGGNRLQ